MIASNRVVVVTGAGRGLGRAHALALAAAGAKVVVNDLGATLSGDGADEAPANEVVDTIRAAGGEAVAHFGDVSDWATADALIGAAVEAFGDLHAVVNNAGIVRDRMFVNSEADEWLATLRVNVLGHVGPAKHAAAYWRARQKAGHAVDGRIVNTTSGAGLQGSVGQAAYSAAKGAIASLTLVQATELGRYGVTANAIAPAARTRMTEVAFADAMRAPDAGFDAMDPANVSPLVVWLASGASGHVTGRVFEVSGGRLGLSDGWRPLPVVDKGGRWSADELTTVVTDLIERAPVPAPVYGA